MGHSINEVNIKRCELIKPDLNDQFKQLCGSHTPVTKLLFGDDLPKSVKEISETNRVGVKVSSKPPTHYNKQQKRSNYHHGTHHQSQKPFLWKYQGPGKRSHQDHKKKGFKNVGYIDDTYLKGSMFHACETNVSTTVKLFTDLGLTLNMAKSVLIPSQSIAFLGFVLNSAKMTVALTPSKAMKVKSKAVELLHNQSPTIRTVSEMIGLMVASFPGVMYGPLYYRQLEIEKVVALKQNQGNFEASMILSDMARSDLHWWIENITDASNTAVRGNCQLIVYSDASLTGWGGVFNSITTGGQWTEDESQNHINYLEILACFLTLKAFCSQIKNCHEKTMIDSSTAVSYINSMGGRSLTCNQITRELWVWCASHGIWLSAAHIPGKENVLADKESRKKHSDTEWKLNPELFGRIATLWGPVSIDLFASRLNYQLKPFVSWRPDPEAMAIDAFSLDWRGLCFYAFPPFSLINRVLQKVEQDQSQGIIIVPMWNTQVWFPRLLHLLIDFPVTIPKGPTTLLLPFNWEKAHPLHKKLTLLACKLSGIPSQQEAFRKKLPKSYCNPGERVLHSPTGVSFGELPTVKQFLKGVFQEKPTLPRYSVTWDPATLLSYLKTLSPVKELTLKMLTYKTVALLGLLSAQRCQTLYFLDIRNMVINSSTVKISIGDKLKQTKPGKHLHELEFPAYPTDICLCIVDVMKEYLERTKPLRGDITSLFVTYVKPYKAASKDTISRWIKTTLKLAGIDMTRTC
ncbi:uncharacterized protein LOC141866599 [Acropora palmata]|uniref:uncharacterized protein LOC141866599 n=1 Tax=Acropora palmata TaxID=6131 RepID=UPI003DA07657